MHKKITIRDQVGKLREQGLKNKVVAERLGINPDTCRVHYYWYRHPKEKKEYAKKDYKKNKEILKEYRKKWMKDNPDKVQEYRYRTKCRRAGVDWRTNSE